MAYADITIRDRNRIKRWLHARRFNDALAPLKSGGDGTLRILDYGAGNGELVRRAHAVGRFEAWVYEPAPDLMAEAKQNLAGLDRLVFVDSLDSVEGCAFDFVFCLEVFEHLPYKESLEAIAAIDRLVKPGGRVLIGVPHELFVPGLVKGLFRMTRRPGEFDARPRNVFAALMGRPPADRPAAEIAPGFNYHFYHLGFDHRVLERRLTVRFELERRWFSPAPFLGAFLNSEVYFLLRKSAPTA
jgi:SAM-dependent methyltransferase